MKLLFVKQIHFKIVFKIPFFIYSQLPILGTPTVANDVCNCFQLHYSMFTDLYDTSNLVTFSIRTTCVRVANLLYLKK